MKQELCDQLTLHGVAVNDVVLTGRQLSEVVAELQTGT